MTTFGIDISHYQAGISLAKVAESPYYTFVVAKATEGRGYHDPEFAGYAVEAARNGFLFAAYHFLRGDSSPEEQAQNIKRVVGDSKVPVILDLERTNGSPQPSMGTARDVRDAARRLGVVIPDLLYLPEWYWSEIGRPDTSGWALWQSNYGSNDGNYPGDTSARWDSHGRTASLLQYTSAGHVPGYPGDIDINAFVGTRADLASKGWFIDYSTPQEDEVATKEEIQTWVANTPILIDNAGTRITLQAALRRILNKNEASPEAVAQAVVAALPKGPLDYAAVQQAVASVLRQGVDGV